MKGNHSHVRNLTGNGSKGFIVFDGYVSNSTKDHSHKKRSPFESLQLNFTDLSKPLLCKKDVFLANTVNKFFLDALGISLQQYEKIEVQHTTDDADRAIFIKCMECLEHSDTILIGDDRSDRTLSSLLPNQSSDKIAIHISTIFKDLCRHPKSYPTVAQQSFGEYTCHTCSITM